MLFDFQGDIDVRKCPYCGDEVVSERSNFCASCGKQLREIPAEDIEIYRPEKRTVYANAGQNLVFEH